MADETPDSPENPAVDPPAGEATEVETATVEAAGAGEEAAGSSGEDAATEAGTTGTGTDTPAKPAVVRKKVTSKRVTPKGAPQGVKASSVAAKTKAKASESDDDDEPSFSKRYTPPQANYAPGPSPWWVPALMFGLLIVGALIIMLNYMGVFGEAENLRLVIGLGFILGGIITATQYR